jgi:hypothetical protein
MIYKFKSKSAGDLIMLKLSGDQVLRVIGKAAAAKGIIEPTAMPAAIMAIEEAIAQEESQRSKADAQAVAEGRTPSRPDGVTLRQRTWPFLDMLKHANGENAAIVWGV